MARSPWQRFYEWGHRRRRRYWSTRATNLGRPTVSIGNLHWGGSGKTPAVIAIARGLSECCASGEGRAGPGLRVAVLSRGYRRRGRGPLVVSLGDRLLVSVDEAGDEPLTIAEQVPGAVVAVGADRRAAAALALERAPDIDVFLLDDGFSHIRVSRDVEILTFPATDPLAGGLLVPGGRLREPMSMVRLADAALLTGLEADAEPPAGFEATLRRHGFAGPVFSSTLRSELLGGPSPERPLLVTGIARPERVARTAAAAGLECVEHLRFADHHAYPPRSLGAIDSACARHRCDAVVTTSKDAVKLRDRLSAGGPPLLELRVEAEIEPEFLPWLAGRLQG
jgi:tetraacyldisaccharide 4'-kinase